MIERDRSYDRRTEEGKHLHVKPVENARVTALRDRHETEAVEMILARSSAHPKEADGLFDRLVELDPTSRKVYLERMLVWAVEGKLTLSDVDRLGVTLGSLLKHKDDMALRGYAVRLTEYAHPRMLEAAVAAYLADAKVTYRNGPKHGQELRAS